MAQTTAAIVQSNFAVDVSTDGTSWSNLGGQAVSVKTSGGEAQVGQQLTADGEYAVVVAGHKVEPLRVTVRALYTATAGEAWRVVWDRFIGTDKTIFLRWAPRGNTSTYLRYNTSAAGTAVAKVPIVKCNPPEQAADSGNPAIFEFEVITPALWEETI